jgi:hypothetical protein
MRMFVLTSMDADAFLRQLHEFSMQDFFEKTYAGVLDKRDLIDFIIETHGLDREETAFVGDMTHDIETARHGGISSIAVLTGYHHAEVLAAVRLDITVPTERSSSRTTPMWYMAIAPPPDRQSAVQPCACRACGPSVEVKIRRARRRVSLRSVSGFFITVVESTSSLIISVLIVVLCGPR